MLMNDNFPAGVRFYENYKQRPLYIGTLDRKGEPLFLEPTNRTTNDSDLTTSRKRSVIGQQLSILQTNATTSILSVPGGDATLELNFYFVGVRLPKVGIFGAILRLLFGLGMKTSTGSVDSTSLAYAGLPVWIYIIRDPTTQFDLAVYHVLAILEAIARYCVQQNSFQELVYDFLVGGALVSKGCLTQPDDSRAWCQGLW